MLYADFSRGYVLKFDQGEKLHETLIIFAEQKRIASGFYQGIGAFSEVEFGTFDLEKKGYTSYSKKGDYELLSASGNLSLVDGKPYPHTHVVLADSKGVTMGGHLFEGTVSLTAEIFFFPLDIALLRKPDAKFKFNALDLPHLLVRGNRT